VFSPDETKLASTSFDKTARVWDVQTGATIASCPGLPFVAFTLNSSRLISLYEHQIYQVDTTTGDTLSMPLGLTTCAPIEGVQVPNLNLWVIRVDRRQPSLNGLLVVKFDKDGFLHFRPLCWFPGLTATSLAVSSLSRIAVGYKNGRVLLLNVDFSSLL
jgi:WD40 repeat protein